MKLFFLIALLILSYGARSEVIAGKYGQLKLEMPKSYSLKKDFLGIPYIFIKQESDKSNTSLSVIPTGVDDVNLDNSLLKKNYKQYTNGKQAWAKKNNYKIQEVLKFDSFSNNSKEKVISAGLIYKNKLGNTNFERTYYILCPREMFQLKFLTAVEFRKNHSIIVSALKLSKCL